MIQSDDISGMQSPYQVVSILEVTVSSQADCDGLLLIRGTMAHFSLPMKSQIILCGLAHHQDCGDDS